MDSLSLGYLSCAVICTYIVPLLDASFKNLCESRVVGEHEHETKAAEMLTGIRQPTQTYQPLAAPGSTPHSS